VVVVVGVGVVVVGERMARDNWILQRHEHT